MTTLPPTRQFLTSLINAISEIPLSQSEPQAHWQREPSNPLKSVPQLHRPLLTTLHVLFPTLLLPALDLLDRHLVTRLWLVPKKSDEARQASPADDNDGSDSDPGTKADAQSDHSHDSPDSERAQYGTRYNPEVHQASSPPHLATSPPPRRPSPPTPSEEPEPTSSLYIVRSSQGSHPRRRREVLAGGAAESAPQKSYVVRLAAWNCTCAAFAFAAFPGGGSRGFGRAGREAGDGTMGGDGAAGGGSGGEEAGTGGEGGAWEFGGVSLDRDVPCCKHLLACLLAERWEGALGRYVEERRVGRNEMAGMVADI